MIVNAFYVMFYQTEVGDPGEDPSHEGDGGGPGGDDVSGRNNNDQQHCQTCSGN